MIAAVYIILSLVLVHASLYVRFPLLYFVLTVIYKERKVSYFVTYFAAVNNISNGLI